MRPWLAFYLGAMGAKEKNFYVDLADRAAHGDVAREVPGPDARRRPGRRRGRADPDELIDATALAATPASLDDRLAAFEPHRREHVARRAVRPRPPRRRPRARGGDRVSERRAPRASRARRCPARSRSASTRRGCASACAASRACRSSARCSASGGPREGLVRVARRRGRAAVLDVARRLRRARDGGRWPTARRSSPPAAATTTPARAPPRRSSRSRSPPAAGRRGRPARPARPAAAHAARRGAFEPQQRLPRPRFRA